MNYKQLTLRLIHFIDNNNDNDCNDNGNNNGITTKKHEFKIGLKERHEKYQRYELCNRLYHCQPTDKLTKKFSSGNRF